MIEHCYTILDKSVNHFLLYAFLFSHWTANTSLPCIPLRNITSYTLWTTALHFVICSPGPYEILPKGVFNCNCDGSDATLVALPDKAGTTETTPIINKRPNKWSFIPFAKWKTSANWTRNSLRDKLVPLRKIGFLCNIRLAFRSYSSGYLPLSHF